jgi:hypothetical protein
MGQGLRYQVCTYCECRTPALAPGNWCEYAVSDPASTDCMAIMVKPTYVQYKRSQPAVCLPRLSVEEIHMRLTRSTDPRPPCCAAPSRPIRAGWPAVPWFALTCSCGPGLYFYFFIFFFYLTVLYHKVTFPLRHRRHVEVTVLGVVKPPDIYNLHPHLSLFLSC